jgi:hypothetical protein
MTSSNGSKILTKEALFNSTVNISKKKSPSSMPIVSYMEKNKKLIEAPAAIPNLK